MFKKSLLILLFFAVFKNAYSSENLILEGNFFPEGIAISRNGDIYVGSLKHNKIVKFKKKDSNHQDFIEANTNGLMSVIGIMSDDRNKILWACSSSPGVSNYPKGDNVFSLKEFDLNNGSLLNSYQFPNCGLNHNADVRTKSGELGYKGVISKLGTTWSGLFFLAYFRNSIESEYFKNLYIIFYIHF